MSQDMLRIIDSICRDRNIDRDVLIDDLSGAIASAVRKAYETEEAEVQLDPLTGHINAVVEGRPVDMQTLGRIATQTAKQVMIQKLRERERVSIYGDFTERRGTIVTGQVVRVEGGNLLANIGRTEGFLPRSERIPGETHQVGDRIRVLILEVREQPNQIKIILSRSNKEFIERLFDMEVPEVAERIIEIKAIAREAGYRTKVAVSSIDSKVDAVGACVGVRGSRIKNIVEELGGEKIDIVRWNESSQVLIQNALKPAEVQEIALCLELGKATVVVAEDQLSLAIGKRGQNVRLAARLSGWDIDIQTPAEYNKNLEIMEQTLKKVEGVDELLLDKLVAIGIVSVQDLDSLEPDQLVEALELTPDLANRIVEEAGEEVIRQEEEKEAAEKAKAEAEAAGLLAGETDEGAAPSAFVADDGATESAPADASPSAESSETPDASEADEPLETTAAPVAVDSDEPPQATEAPVAPQAAAGPSEDVDTADTLTTEPADGAGETPAAQSPTGDAADDDAQETRDLPSIAGGN